jgi:GT2 family glycosyltransferase
MISVLILAYNSADFVSEAVQSVLTDRGSPEAVEVIVFDNASQDATSQRLRAEFAGTAGVTLLRSKRPLGYAGGNNAAAAAAKGEILLVLNDDCVLEPGTLSGIKRDFDEEPGLGVLQCAIATADGRKWDSLGHHIDSLGLLHIIAEGETRAGTAPTRRPVFGAQGAAFAVRASLFQLLDGFDEAFQFLFEETDFCWRALLRGYDVAVSGRAVARHRKLARYKNKYEGRQGSAFYMLTRNRIRSMIKNLSPAKLITLGGMHLLLLLGYAAKNAFRRDPAGLTDVTRALWWNICRLRTTLRLRRQIQSTRIVSDNWLMESGRILKAHPLALPRHPLW